MLGEPPHWRWALPFGVTEPDTAFHRICLFSRGSEDADGKKSRGGGRRKGWGEEPKKIAKDKRLGVYLSVIAGFPESLSLTGKPKVSILVPTLEHSGPVSESTVALCLAWSDG